MGSERNVPVNRLACVEAALNAAWTGPASTPFILEATGRIPSETIKLISALRVTEDPLEVAREWKVTFRMPAGLLSDPLGKALSILDMGDDEDAETFNDGQGNAFYRWLLGAT